MNDNKNMDIGTIKSMVISMRQNGNNGRGMSFQAISDKLREEYSIVKSRQAVQGLYVRATEDELRAGENFKLSVEICNVYCLGYNLTETTEIINSIGYSVSYQKICNAVKFNSDYLNWLLDSMKYTVLNNFSADSDVTIIKQLLGYRGFDATQEKFDELIYLSCIDKIKESSIEHLKTAYKLTNNAELIKRLNKNRLDIPTDILKNTVYD